MAKDFEKIITEVSLAVRPIDDFTDGDPIGGIRVYIQGMDVKPIRNDSGYYVFINQPDNATLKVMVESDYYFPQEVDVNLQAINKLNPVKYVILTPNTTYPFESNSTLLRGVVQIQEGGVTAEETAIEAVVTNIIKAKIGRNGAHKGGQTVSLANISGRIMPGDILRIKEGDESLNEDIHIRELIAADGGVKTFSIVGNIKNDHPYMTPLLHVINTKTSQKNEFVVYFRTVNVKELAVNLKITHGSRNVNKEVRVNEEEVYKNLQILV